MSGKIIGRIFAVLNRILPGKLHEELMPCSVMTRHLSMDPTQASFLKEQCIAVDTNDKVLGSLSKEEAHLLGSDGMLPPLHRAFSVFLFNTKNELLMQQRSSFKITFPGNLKF